MMRALWLILLSASVSCAVAQKPGEPSFSDTEVIPSFREANAGLAEFETLLRKPVDATHTLLVVRGRIRMDQRADYQEWLREDYLGLFLQDSANPKRVWKLAVFQNDEPGMLVKAERTDGNTLVLSRTTDYGIRRPSLKWPLWSPRVRATIATERVPAPEVRQLTRKLIALLEPFDEDSARLVSYLTHNWWVKAMLVRTMQRHPECRLDTTRTDRTLESDLESLAVALSYKSRKWRYRLEKNLGEPVESFADLCAKIESRLPILQDWKDTPRSEPAEECLRRMIGK